MRVCCRGESVERPSSASLGTWLELRIEGVEVRGVGLGFRVWSVRVWVVGFGGEALVFRGQGSGFRVQGSGFRG